MAGTEGTGKYEAAELGWMKLYAEFVERLSSGSFSLGHIQRES
jgi:hypothetical protein